MPENQLIALIKQVSKPYWDNLIAQTPEVQEDMTLEDFEDEIRIFLTA